MPYVQIVAIDPLSLAFGFVRGAHAIRLDAPNARKYIPFAMKNLKQWGKKRNAPTAAPTFSTILLNSKI